MGHLNRVHLLFLFHLLLFMSTFHLQSAISGRSTYIIHMNKSLMPRIFSKHDQWYSSIMDSFNNSESSPSLIYAYDNAFHGFSAHLSKDELKALKKFPGFVSASSDSSAKLQTTYTPEYLSLHDSADLWRASSYGKDVIIGVLDTGIWPESQSFEDAGMATKVPTKWKGVCEGGHDFNSSMCNSKLIGVRFFNHGLKATSKQIVDSARDTIGHGTHVSSIAAGNYVKGVSYFGYAKGTAKGVAPHARLAMYKVIWEEGYTQYDVLAGIDRAISDGVDVISISMGIDTPLDQNAIAKGSFAAMEKGIVVVTSAGNTGPNFATLSHGIPWVTTVTSATIDRWFSGTLTLGNGLTIIGWTLYSGITFLQNLPLVYNKTLAACTSSKLLSKAPFGIILCDLGDVKDQISTISASNLPGAIFTYLVPSLVHMREISCAWVVITPQNERILIKYIESNSSPIVSLTFKQTSFGSRPTPTVSPTASRGPALTCPGVLKPDIMAPGSMVLGAWVPKRKVTQINQTLGLYSNYNIESGTSAACPHVAGVAALLRGAHPEWSAAAIKSAIMTTANPLDSTLKPIQDPATGFQFASPLDMGSGMVDPNRALNPGLIYDITPQDYVNLLCAVNFEPLQILSITRSSTYNCKNPSSDLNYPSFIAFCSDSMTIKEFHRTVTNVGANDATYRVEVTAPEGSEVIVSPKTLIFKQKNKKQSYTLTTMYRGHKKGHISFGALVWVEKHGNHRVRSPIIMIGI